MKRLGEEGTWIESESKGITSHGDWFNWHTCDSNGTEPPCTQDEDDEDDKDEENRRGESLAFLRILIIKPLLPPNGILYVISQGKWNTLALGLQPLVSLHLDA